MKPFSVACEAAFNERFGEDESIPSTSIDIWREAWFAAYTHALDQLEAETPGGSHE